MVIGMIAMALAIGRIHAQTRDEIRAQRATPGPSYLVPGDKANMVYLDPIFTIGTPKSEPYRRTDENQHQLVLTSSFYMGKYEATQDEYLSVVGDIQVISPRRMPLEATNDPVHKR